MKDAYSDSDQDVDDGSNDQSCKEEIERTFTTMIVKNEKNIGCLTYRDEALNKIRNRNNLKKLKNEKEAIGWLKKSLRQSSNLK